jgi:hypothetical protein
MACQARDRRASPMNAPTPAGAPVSPQRKGRGGLRWLSIAAAAIAVAHRIAKSGVTSKDDLKTKTTNALRRLQKLPHLVRGFFRDPNLAYITA